MEVLKTLIKRLYPKILSIPFLIMPKMQSNLSKKIAIISFHRSGSTWLLEHLMRCMNAVSIYEPLYQTENHILLKLFKINTAIYPKNKIQTEFIIEYLKKIFHKEYFTRWNISRTKLSDLYARNTLIVKFIRANFIVQLLKFNFPDVKLIFLFRNPFALIESVINSGGNWKNANKQYLKIYFLDYFKDNPELSTFVNKLNDEPRLVLLVKWCIEVKTTLSYVNDSDLIIFYEYFKDGNFEYLSKLYKFLNINADEAFLKYNQSQPSSTTSKINFIKEKTPYWINKYDENKINLMNEVLSFFQIDFYKIESYYPILINSNIKHLVESEKC